MSITFEGEVDRVGARGRSGEEFSFIFSKSAAQPSWIISSRSYGTRWFIITLSAVLKAVSML